MGIRHHIRSNIVGYVALFVALSGVTYAAGAAKNSVTSTSIKKGAVQGIDVKDDTLTGTDVSEPTLADVPSATNAGQLDKLDSSAFVLDADGAGGDLSGVFSNLNINAGAVGTAELSSTAVRAQNLAPIGTAGVPATVPMVFIFPIDDGNDITRIAVQDLLVIDAWTIGKSTDAGTVELEGPGGTAITEQIDPVDGTIVRAANIDPGNWNLAAGEALTADASNNLVDVHVLALAIGNIAP